MKTYLMPGYGNRTDYLRLATRDWSRRYGLQPEVYIFGWENDVDTYATKWQAFDQKIQEEPDEIAIVAVSASVSIALRAMQTHPHKVAKVVGICGPVHADKMDSEKLLNKYPVLERSLGYVSIERLRVQDVRTYYSHLDNVVPTAAAIIDGTESRELWTPGHALTIGYAMFRYGGEMARFIHPDPGQAA